MRPLARLIALVAPLAAGLGLAPAPIRAQEPASLTVFAAASLTEAFTALGKLYEDRHRGGTVHLNFAGSQQLAVQLEQGAAADVFASADARWMAYAEERKLVAGAPQVFARNQLVIIVPRANPGRIERLGDLARPGLKLVVAAEAVPVGTYTRQMLDRLGRAPGFPADFAARALRNVVSEEDNVKGVVAKVQLGEADAGVVYRSDLSVASARQVRALGVPEAYNVVAAYPIAVLSAARSAVGARAFVALVRSPEGQRVLARSGFLPAEETAERAPAR